MNELEQKVAQLKAMTPDELDNLDVYKFGYQAFLVYEAEKLMPKKEGTMKGVTFSNSFALYQEADAIANVNGKPYLATKQEDPDDEDDEGLYVWAFSRPEDSSSIDYSSYTQDKTEAIADFKKFLTKKESSGLHLIEGILNIESSLDKDHRGKSVSVAEKRKKQMLMVKEILDDLLSYLDPQDKPTLLANLLMKMTRSGSPTDWWKGSISVSDQRRLFGDKIGQGSFFIDGSKETVSHSKSVGFGQDFETTWQKKWSEL